MADIVDKQTRSRMMSGIKGKDTRPEMIVRRFLHARGFRYRLHVSNLPGKPDICLPRYGVVILVQGCFWHRHKGCKLSYMPASNKERWKEKFRENVRRDRKNIKALIEEGWRVIVLWECGLRKADEKLLNWLPGKIRKKAGEKFIEWS